jgi:hypothetical protein
MMIRASEPPMKERRLSGASIDDGNAGIFVSTTGNRYF